MFAVVVMALTSQTVLAPAAQASGEIEGRYSTDIALRGALGAPSGDEYSIGNGRQRNFKWGSLYWSPAASVHEVHGAIRWRYELHGGPAGSLGFPTTDEGREFIKYDIPENVIGARNDFQNGAIVWSNSTDKTYVAGKTVAENLPYNEYPFGYMPVADERAGTGGSRVLQLNGGLMYVTPTGFFHLHDGYPSGSNGILTKYVATGADAGFLGLPVSDEAMTASPTGENEGRVRKFKWGNIYQCGVLLGTCEIGKAHEVHGGILWRFNLEGGVPKLGFPVSDEENAPGGRVSKFQKGKVFWNSVTGKTSVTYY